jgi:hypothetical protein
MNREKCGKRGQWLDVAEMVRRFRLLLEDRPELARPSRVRQAWRRHVEWCPEERRPWRLVDVPDLEHCDAYWKSDDCSGCEELADLLEPWGVDMKPTLRAWTLDVEVPLCAEHKPWEGRTRARWEAAERVAGRPPDSGPSVDAPALFETGPGFAEYVQVKREVLG